MPLGETVARDAMLGANPHEVEEFMTERTQNKEVHSTVRIQYNCSAGILYCSAGQHWGSLHRECSSY